MSEGIKFEESGTFEPVLVPDNLYEVEVENYRIIETQYGKTLAVGFKILKDSGGGDAFKGKIIDGLASITKFTPKTKLHKWVTDLKIKLPAKGETFSFESMIGAKGKIITGTKTKTMQEGEIEVSIIKEVLPL